MSITIRPHQPLYSYMLKEPVREQLQNLKDTMQPDLKDVMQSVIFISEISQCNTIMDETEKIPLIMWGSLKSML